MRNYERLNGRWVAYDAGGFAFRCKKLSDSSWYGYRDNDARTFGASTLSALASKIGASNAE